MSGGGWVEYIIKQRSENIIRRSTHFSSVTACQCLITVNEDAVAGSVSANAEYFDLNDWY